LHGLERSVDGLHEAVMIKKHFRMANSGATQLMQQSIQILNGRRNQYELTHVLFFGELLLRLNDFIEWKRFCQKGSDLTMFDVGNKIWENRLVPCGASNQP